MYGNFFDDLFNSLSNSWCRGFKEKDGYTVLEAKDGKGYLIVFNTLGVSKDDIKVVHQPAATTKYLEKDTRNGESTYIRVYGNTKIPELNNQIYSVNYEILFRNPNPVDEIQYIVRDGLTLVYVKTKEPDNNSGTAATSIADGGSFNW